MKEKKFNVTRNEEGNVVGIEFNAEAFIIPNHSCKIDGFFGSYVKRVKKLATGVLGREPEEDEDYIQMWYVVDDLGCDNLVDHSARVEIDGKKYVIRMDSCYLPYSVLRNKNEGDTIDVIFNNRGLDEDEPHESIQITMHVTLKQKGYRYGSFGYFQEVLKKVLW